MTLQSERGGQVASRAHAEAAAWIALLHSPERNAAIESGLRRWIAEDPSHAIAWEQATELWNEAATISRSRSWRVARKAPPRGIPRPVFASVFVGLLAAGWALYQYLQQGALSTAIGEQKMVTLQDGSRVELNTDSRLLVSYDPRVRTVVLKSGEAYFNVAHESRPFVVLVGDRKVIAVGTSFTVRRDPLAGDIVTVTLIEGKVAVAPIGASNTLSQAPTSQATVLTAGERLRLHRRAPPTLDVPSVDKVTGWMRGQLVFDHTPLEEAAAEFNRYSPARISVASPAVGQIPVGGIFRISDAKSFARAVAAAHHLRLVMHDDELLLE